MIFSKNSKKKSDIFKIPKKNLIFQKSGLAFHHSYSRGRSPHFENTILPGARPYLFEYFHAWGTSPHFYHSYAWGTPHLFRCCHSRGMSPHFQEEYSLPRGMSPHFDYLHSR